MPSTGAAEEGEQDPEPIDDGLRRSNRARQLSQRLGPEYHLGGPRREFSCVRLS